MLVICYVLMNVLLLNVCSVLLSSSRVFVFVFVCGVICIDELCVVIIRLVLVRVVVRCFGF